MRKCLFLVVVLWSRQAYAQLAVTDPGVSAIAKMQLEVTQLHNQFVQSQMIQDAITLKNSYLQAMSYYNYINQLSQHHGGLVGYYESYFSQQMTLIAEDQQRKFMTEATTITGVNPVSQLAAMATGAVNNGVGAGISATGGVVSSGINTIDGGYKNVRGTIFQTQATHTQGVQQALNNNMNAAAATNAMIADLVTRGNATGINDKERESMELQAHLLQLQTLSQIRGLLAINTQTQTDEAVKNMAEAALAINSASTLSTYRVNAANRRTAVTSGNNDAIVTEMQRKP